jgi:hypothetical protein
MTTPGPTCPLVPTFAHSSLTLGAACPFCHQIPSTNSPATAPAQSIATANTLAQYTPVAAGTVAALRQTIGSGNALKSKTPGGSQPIIPLLDVTKFHVRVAHARYTDQTPPQTLWTVFTDGWFVAINNNTPVTFEQLKETFRAQGQAQYIDYFSSITKPEGHGHWTLSTNHLAPNHPAPQIWCTWEGAYCIQDAMKIQDYSSAPTGANGKAKSILTYPVTLLWYPRIRKDSDGLSLSSWRWAVAEESLLPVRGSSPGFQRHPSISEAGWEEITGPPEPRNPAAKGKGKGKGKEKEKVAHKRQISEAIPRNERDNGGLSRPEAAPARTQESTQKGTQTAGQEAGQKGAQEGTRKSGRARKPKPHD